MKKRLWWRSVVCACVFLSAGVGRARNQYSESFTTTTYKDAANTTADWNTAAGELKLFPFAPSLVGSFATSAAWDVAMAGDVAFVTDQFAGLRIIDAADPAGPTLAGGVDPPGLALGVVVVGDLAFVAGGGAGLHVINIANPASPALLGTCNTPGLAYDVAMAGNLAFVADGDSGLQVINITNPANPTTAGAYDTPGTAYAVAVDGDLAFVADDASGLQIIDVANPASPALVGAYDTPGLAEGVAVDGDRVFVADGYAGVKIVDVTNPASPTLVGTYATPTTVHAVAVDGDLAFVACAGTGLVILDVADPSSPTLAGGQDTPGEARHVAMAGALAFVADGTGGLRIIRVGHPVTFPRLAGGCNTPGQIGETAVAGDLAFVADGSSGGLQIISIANPSSPVLVGAYDTPGLASGVAVDGDLAFVADGNSGLQIIDISYPANPTFVGSCATPLALRVAVDGDLAVVAVAGSGLRIVSIANPATPTIVGSYPTGGVAYAVTVAGDLALVANGTSGLEIVSISDPTNPVHVGTYATGGVIAYTVEVAGDLAFVANGTNGLQIVSIADPANPVLAGACSTPDLAFDVAVAGDLAVLACRLFGLQCVDIADPARPTLLGACDTPGVAWDVAVAGEVAFVADSADLRVIRVFQHDVDELRNAGRSLAVDGGGDTIHRVRLSTTQTAGVTWQVSADNGTSWQTVVPDRAWNEFAVPGNDLQWRSIHVWAGVNPAVSELHMEWLYEYGGIVAVSDVPGDQGGRVYVDWKRSCYDFAGETDLPVTGYNLYRRVDEAAFASAVRSDGSAEITERLVTPSGQTAWPLPGARALLVQGRTYVTGSSAAAAFPPGTWALVGVAYATQRDDYRAEATTTADSSMSGTHHSVYLVTTHTIVPAVWFASPPDSGYSVDNIAPAVPADLLVAYNTGSGNTLSWDPSPDADFQYFRVYRSTDPDFVLSPANRVCSTTSTGWIDPGYDGWLVYYKVTAIDYAGNESAPASPTTVSGVGTPGLPKTFALHPNVPNPFGPITIIAYDVPERGGDLSLRIYDVRGKLVRTLLEGAQTAGAKAATWDGRDNAGRPVGSGVYFCRLTAAGLVRSRKMVLTR